jgi:hypothetical protein
MCGLGPGRVGESVLVSEFFLKEVDVEDQGRFGFVVSGVNFLRGRELASWRIVRRFSLVKSERGR